MKDGKFKAVVYCRSQRSRQTYEQVCQMVRQTLEKNGTKLEIEIVPCEELERYKATLKVVVDRYESVGDNESHKQGVSFGVYTVCKEALTHLERTSEDKK